MTPFVFPFPDRLYCSGYLELLYTITIALGREVWDLSRDHCKPSVILFTISMHLFQGLCDTQIAEAMFGLCPQVALERHYVLSRDLENDIAVMLRTPCY